MAKGGANGDGEKRKLGRGGYTGQERCRNIGMCSPGVVKCRKDASNNTESGHVVCQLSICTPIFIICL